MKTKGKISICTMIIIAMVIMVASGCKKKKENPEIQVPVLTTLPVTDITQIAALSGGNISSDAGDSPTVRGVCWSTQHAPTIADSKTSDGTGFGEFHSNMELLVNGKVYYVRAYATNSAGTGYGNEVNFTTQQASPDTITDIDGNVYHVVTIGTQDWLVENLEVTHYRNGDPVSFISDSNAWAAASEGAYCNYDNSELAGKIYGKLYNWKAVDDPRILAPAGFHIPSDDEWTTLTTYLGGVGVAGGKLKETGLTHWDNPNVDATNETGFSALPGGWRDGNGDSGNYTMVGYFWASTEYSGGLAWMRTINSNSALMVFDFMPEAAGLSVRCVRD